MRREERWNRRLKREGLGVIDVAEAYADATLKPGTRLKDGVLVHSIDAHPTFTDEHGDASELPGTYADIIAAPESEGGGPAGYPSRSAHRSRELFGPNREGLPSEWRELGIDYRKQRGGMRCPLCNAPAHVLPGSHPHQEYGAVTRTRRCTACRHLFVTLEMTPEKVSDLVNALERYRP